MIIFMLRFLILLIALVYGPQGLAYNRSYEERISNELAASAVDGDEIWLSSGAGRFLALYRDFATAEPRGAVILVHGMGGHADWPDVIMPLRESLPALGWATLSLQMPVLSPTENFADYGQTLGEAKRRLRVAVSQLRDWRYQNVVILGHSFGAATAVHALAGGGLDDVRALVGISMQAQQFLNPRLRLLRELESIAIPVLDIYAARDMPEVLLEVDDRRLAARKNGNQDYQQAVVDGADHYFTGLDDVLLRRIQGWLLKISPESRAVDEDGPKEQEIKQESALEE